MVLPPLNTSTFSLLSALDADIAREDETAQLEVPTNVPVREPVNDPVIGLVRLFNWSELEMVPAGSPDGRTNDAVIAFDAVIALDDETAQLAVPVNDPIREPVKEPVIGFVRLLNCSELDIVPAGSPVGSTYDAVIALDDVMERDDDSAHDEVPRNEPVIPWVTFNDPVMLTPLPDTKSEPVMTADPLNGNPGVAFSANEAVSTLDADTAQLEVPKNEPL